MRTDAYVKNDSGRTFAVGFSVIYAPYAGDIVMLRIPPHVSNVFDTLLASCRLVITFTLNEV